MKIFLLGAGGMLGSALSNILAKEELFVGDLPYFDLTKFEDLKKKISDIKPEVIINTAAYTDVDGCETEQEKCNLLNGEAVGNLAKIADELGATLVHYSTDYVFDGQNKNGYGETDQPDPINAYGQSKLLGEQQLQQYCKNYYLIRTAWLYGQNGKNFVNTILEKAEQGQALEVVNDQFGSPTFTLDLARATLELLQNKAKFGIYHLTNSSSCSWHELAAKILEITGFKNQLKAIPSGKSDRPAKRPNYSILNNNKTNKLRPWDEALADYLQNIKISL